MKFRWLLTVGMAVFASCSVSAADITSVGSPPREAATPNWNGFYLGAISGVSKGASNWSHPMGGGISEALPRFPTGGVTNGILFGGTIGFNRQFDSLLVGVEGDLAFSTGYGAAVCGGVYGNESLYIAHADLASAGNWRCQNRSQLYATLAPRIGYASGNALFYAKAGVAFGHSNFEIEGMAQSRYRRPRTTHASSDETTAGWLVGAGMEYALGGPWSAKIEYTRIQFAAKRWQGFEPNWETYQGAKVRSSLDVVKFGLNYRWGDVDSPANAAPVLNTDLSGEFGGRLGMAFSDYSLNLGDPYTPGQMNSRLTWADQKALAVEAFGRIDHSSGVFLKGLMGGVGLGNGEMNDEDFPPGEVPYSNTKSDVRNSNGLYATADLGWAYRGAGWRLGAFAGFSHNQQQMHAYECTQIAGGNICGPLVAVAEGAGILSRHESWNGIRLGLAADLDITDRLKLSVDAAYLPKLNYRGRDNHWARAGINPMIDTGTGHGYQLEAIASYRVSERVALGVGARRWSSTAKGSVSFPGSPASPVKVSSDRTTVFVQATYRFGELQ